jgi:glycosyltransferase involved in cell wall biosynthesis
MEYKPIHYIIWQVGRGGAEMLVSHYIDHFNNVRPIHIYSVKEFTNNIYGTDQVSIRSGPSGKWSKFYQYYRYCRKHKGDVFHLVGPGPFILLISLLAGIRNPIYHVHGTIYWKKKREKWYLKPIWIFCSWFKVNVVPNSMHSQEVFSRDVFPIGGEPIYNCFDVEKFASIKTLRKELKKIGYIGRFAQGKNVHLVIRLFEEIAPKYPDVELYLAGEGPIEHEVKDLVAKSMYTDRIHVLGFVKDIVSFYESIDLLLFLSSYESFGNVVAEGLLTGVPVLTSSVPVFSEITGSDSDFELGNPSNYAELKNRFFYAIKHFPKLAKKAFKVSDYVYNKFPIHRHMEAFERLYEDA